MNVVPIAFAFDDNLVLPACVCISSLMMNAKEDTFYDIFILHSGRGLLNRGQLDRIPDCYKNCRIQYRTVDNSFDNAFEIRGITSAAYYRLLLPEIVSEYDKIIYSDVDIIYRMDLNDLYSQDISQYYLAATLDLGINLGPDGIRHINSIGSVEPGKYLQSGFLVMNLRRMRENGLIRLFKEHGKRKYKYQDQDILNVVCRNEIKYLSPEYNMTDYSYYYMSRCPEKVSGLFGERQIKAILYDGKGNLHFNGHKPWKKYSVNFDIWWEYYRKSPFFDPKFYFDFFYGKLDELDRLSLWKRIKILARYFVYGRK